MVEEFHNSKYKDKKFKTMSLSIKRLKTQNLNPHADDVVNFVHKDNVSKCLIFSLFYHNVMNQNHNAEAMFPTWKAHVKQDKDGTDSQVSKYFKKFWIHLHKRAMEYADMFDDLSSEEIELIKEYCFEEMAESRGIHCGKKKGVQELGDSDLVPQVSF